MSVCTTVVSTRSYWPSSRPRICGFAALGTFSVLRFFRSLVPLPLQSFDISRCGLIQLFLQNTPVVQTAAYLRHQFFGNVNGETSSLQATVQDVTGMLSSRQASGAALANTRTAAQAERAQHGGPEVFRFPLEPAPDIGKRFRLD